MVFKRRTPRSYLRIIAEAFWPRGGWSRAASYVVHRLRRLPDAPHRIARGIAAGVFVSFTPLFGLHFLAAAGIAMVIRGNVLASLLATFVGNPLTFPFIAGLALEVGNFLLGRPDPIALQYVFGAFSSAAGEIWHNLTAIFTSELAHWDRLAAFWRRVFLPYLLGGLVPGALTAAFAYWLTLPAVTAYQKRRIKHLRLKMEKRLAAKAKLAAGSDG